eukprot:364133-Chlamydomonas_euryale.AAC.13
MLGPCSLPALRSLSMRPHGLYVTLRLLLLHRERGAHICAGLIRWNTFTGEEEMHQPNLAPQFHEQVYATAHASFAGGARALF